MSDNLDELLCDVQAKADKFIALVYERLEIRLKVIQTYRTYDEQEGLYAQGRSKKGPIVTYARGGQSWHCFRRALDVIPLLSNGKPWWNAPINTWECIAAIAAECGLEWGGSWKGRKQDLDHFQDRGGMSLDDCRAINEKEHPQL